MEASQHYFNDAQLRIVNRTCERAAKLVSDHYRVTPGEWLKMPYEVRTLRALDSSEVTDEVTVRGLPAL